MMYEVFGDLRTVTRTQTNVLLLLDDPDGGGREFTNVVNVILDGTMEVFTQPPVMTRAGMSLLPWWVGEMPSVGESTVGTIHMTGNPNLTTTGVIRQEVGDRPFPATLEAAVYQVLDVPGYGRLHNNFPVLINGDVQEIPPFFTVAKCANALLLDEENRPRGMVAGRTLTLLGPA
jgi:hypothetical protein